MASLCFRMPKHISLFVSKAEVKPLKMILSALQLCKQRDLRALIHMLDGGGLVSRQNSSDKENSVSHLNASMPDENQRVWKRRSQDSVLQELAQKRLCSKDPVDDVAASFSSTEETARNPSHKAPLTTSMKKMMFAASLQKAQDAKTARTAQSADSSDGPHRADSSTSGLGVEQQKVLDVVRSGCNGTCYILRELVCVSS